MDTRNPVLHVWHPEYGLVFGKGSQVVDTRPFLVRFHSSTADAAEAAPLSNGADEPLPNPPSTGTERSSPEAVTPQGPIRSDGLNEAAEASGKKETPLCVPPFTPLNFKIPEKLFREAKLAEPGSPESFWSYGLYRGPGGEAEPGPKVKVHYCKSQLTTERVLKQYFMDEKILGFDLEWQADASRFQGPRRNVCLVQIASTSRVALFQLSLYPKSDSLVAPSLKKIMEDPQVTKVGVSIKSDCTRLRTFLGVEPRGIFELSHLYKLVKYSSTGDYGMINRKLVNMAQQVEDYLQLPMFKGQEVRSSDWSQSLRMDQILYSASDAYAAVQLYAVLDHHRQNLDPEPPMPYHAELNKPIRLADGATAISTADETLDAEAEEPPSAPETKSYGLTAKYLTSFRDSVKIEAESDTLPSIPTPAAAKPAAPAPRSKDPRILEAETWLAQFRAAHPKTKAAAASLRAYYIWYKNEDLRPDSIAALLRNPPLQTSTVTNYILEAIRQEKLSFQRSRLRQEVVDLLPKDLLSTRYRTVMKLCQEPDGNQGEVVSNKQA